jgi:hypothetical protein
MSGGIFECQPDNPLYAEPGIDIFLNGDFMPAAFS